jgi:hypothetical protein
LYYRFRTGLGASSPTCPVLRNPASGAFSCGSDTFFLLRCGPATVASDRLCYRTYAKWPNGQQHRYPKPRSPGAYPLRGFTLRTLSNWFQQEARPHADDTRASLSLGLIRWRGRAATCGASHRPQFNPQSDRAFLGSALPASGLRETTESDVRFHPCNLEFLPLRVTIFGRLIDGGFYRFGILRNTPHRPADANAVGPWSINCALTFR